MKICVVSRGDIFPPNHGAAVKLYYTMTSLDELDHEVFFVTEEEDKYYHLEDGEFKERKYPKIFQKAFSNLELYKKIMMWLGVPEKDWILYHPTVNINMWLRTLYVALREDVDILQSEFPAFAFPALFTKLLTGKRTSLVEHNIEYFRIQRSADNLSERGKKTIKFIDKFTGKLSNYLVTVSEEDEERLKELGVETTEIIPHGVDIDRFLEGDGKRIRKKYDIDDDEVLLIYHGVLNYPPNKEAAEIIVNEIMPELRKRDRKFRALIVGGHPPQFEDEDVITPGFVDELEDYVNAADLAVVPLKAGGGTRMKLLEYFISEIPVICTEKGAEGLEIEDGEELVIAEIDDFTDEIERLLEDDKLRENIKKKGKEFVEKLSWKNIGKMYEKLYKE